MISGLDGRHIADAASLVRARSISVTELVLDSLARADNRRDLNAFTLLMRDQALADAAEADREIAAGRYRGPLHGIPITVKDLVDVRGTATTTALCTSVMASVPRRTRAGAS
jgi:Asp-tRNA(Asn)/Glu-tRNA(Gln) amidotransferase A subunit family amidase